VNDHRRDDLISTILEAFPEEVRETVPARVAFLVAAALTANHRGASLPALTPQMEAAANGTDVSRAYWREVSRLPATRLGRCTGSRLPSIVGSSTIRFCPGWIRRSRVFGTISDSRD
jgi:hypothetical protein